LKQQENESLKPLRNMKVEKEIWEEKLVQIVRNNIEPSLSIFIKDR
jgi:hypothetical protein